MHEENFRIIESSLQQHPGVRQVTISTTGNSQIAAYIVPNQQYLDELEDPKEESRRLNQWRTVYNWFAKSKGTGAGQGLDTSIWNSSYTRQAIPAEEMQEWADLTAEEILSLNPSDVLEIGCGTGALLLRILPSCKKYVGADFSAASLKSIASQIEGSGKDITLLERAADQLEDVGGSLFDTVILNSVLQCFPSLDYLVKVFHRMIQLTKPGGSIFIGDVRNFALLPAFAASVELYQAEPSVTLEELRNRARKRVHLERELVVSPAFFLVMKESEPQVSSVRILPKKGRFDNEMNRFRYDVVIRVDSNEENLLQPEWRDWSAEKLTLDSLRQLLQKKPERLALASVPNSRVEKDVETLHLLLKATDLSTAGELKEELARSGPKGVAPYDLIAVGKEAGYSVEMSWANSRTDGSYDAFFRRNEVGSVAWPAPVDMSTNLAEYVSDPSVLARRQKLLQQLRDFIAEKLPESQRPTELYLVD